MESGITLGILAGGRATRLGGQNKAWLQRDGEPQVVRIARSFGRACDDILVSTNADSQRLLGLGLRAIPDRMQDAGPLGGLDALADACATPWLFTIPVDLVVANDGLMQALQVGADGAVAEDEDGLQPLVALYCLDPLRLALVHAIAAGDHSVRAMQARMRLPRVRFAGQRFGNLNTPADLRAAGCDP